MLTEEYFQHNLAYKTGRDAFIDSVTHLDSAPVKTTTNNIHTFYVLSVSEGTFANAPTSYYDLWRIENGKIVEHWDIIETIADKYTWQNKNGKF